MGIAAPDLILMLNLHAAGRLSAGARILDLGAQNLFCRDQDVILASFLKTFAPQAKVDAARIAELANGGFAGDLFTLAGFDYLSLDVFEAPRCMYFDLNFDLPPAHMLGAYDLVMNHGTTEHVLNQFHSYKLIHDLTKPGGVMIHVLPFQGYVDHGFFCYSGKFFQRLADYNGYRVLELGFPENPAGAKVPQYIRGAPAQLRPGGTFGSDNLRDAGVVAILQKQATEGFVPPLDVDIENVSRADMQKLRERSRQPMSIATGAISPPAPGGVTTIRTGGSRSVYRRVRRWLAS